MRRSFSVTLSVFLYAVVGAFAVLNPVSTIRVTNSIVSPDGFSRSAIVAEGNLPGPLLAAPKGSQFQVNVINLLQDPTMKRSTSIHWHGLFQSDTMWADGPSFVTQCPIPAKRSFNYQFSSYNQAGTFWYHAHVAPQYCDGLRGPLVIYDPADPMLPLYDVDDETTVIALMDWYHIVSTQAGRDPIPDSTLINGLGRFSGGPASPLSVISVQQGKRYRFRLINMACSPNFLFSIDGHQFSIIEVDGTTVQPLLVDSLRIFVGQRYSFVLQATQPVDNYWIRASPSRGFPSFDGGVNSAILRYVGAPVAEPVTPQTVSTLPLVESSLQPFVPTPAPGSPQIGGADVVLHLQFGIDPNNFNFLVNGASFIPPTIPVLLQILSGAQRAQDLLPPGSVYTLPKNKVVELTLSGGLPGGPHPFHLHGHNFHVVRAAGSTQYNYVNPPIRDVVSAGGQLDNVTLRFVTDNSGPWFFHCHIEWHLQGGLGIVFAEDIKGIRVEAVNIPPAVQQICNAYNSLPPSQQ